MPVQPRFRFVRSTSDELIYTGDCSLKAILIYTLDNDEGHVTFYDSTTGAGTAEIQFCHGGANAGGPYLYDLTNFGGVWFTTALYIKSDQVDVVYIWYE